MHIPDGFIDAATSLGAGGLSVAGVGVAVRKASASLEEGGPPLAGLAAAFVFAAQMLNFPVAAGTSGHLIGAALATVLLGPWVGVVCLAVVVGVQALFADGGLSALGLNILNLALVAGLGGYGTFILLRAVLARSRAGLIAAAGLAGGLSVVLTTVAFVVEYSIGGTAEVDPARVATAMISIHALVALGEGVITAAAVGALLDVRPDLVFGARHLLSARPSRPEPVGAER